MPFNIRIFKDYLQCLCSSLLLGQRVFLHMVHMLTKLIEEGVENLEQNRKTERNESEEGMQK